MTKTSAGLLMYRKRDGIIEVLLGHPGGPFWAKKDGGAWSIPKGEYTNEDPLSAAKREFKEETGCEPIGNFIPLSPVIQKSGKVVSAWAIESDCDLNNFKSNITTIEWPPKSGRQIEIPEIDRIEWFDLETAKQKVNSAQIKLIEEIENKLNESNFLV